MSDAADRISASRIAQADRKPKKTVGDDSLARQGSLVQIALYPSRTAEQAARAAELTERERQAARLTCADFTARAGCGGSHAACRSWDHPVHQFLTLRALWVAGLVPDPVQPGKGKWSYGKKAGGRDD